MKVLTELKESQYEWAVIPSDLPKENLVLITAKTTAPTIHLNDPQYKVRIFNPKELQEAARSLARRNVGVNHIRRNNPLGAQFLPEYLKNKGLVENDGLIEGAFTVDAQWNATTNAVEALIYLPTEYIESIKKEEAKGTPVKFSVEYAWRDEKRTEAGVEFIGLVFDRVDLIYNIPAGDKNTSCRLLESTDLPDKRGLMEADVVMEDYGKLFEAADEFLKHLGEPFGPYKDFDDCVAKNQDKRNPEAYCGYIKYQIEDSKKKEAVLKNNEQIQEEEVNVNAEDKNSQDATPVVFENEDLQVKEEKEIISEVEKKLKESQNPDKNTQVQTTSPDTTLTVNTQTTASTQTSQAIPEDINKKLKESQDRIIELEAVIAKLQENAKTYDSEKKKAVEQAKKETREKIISSIESILPNAHIISNFNLGGQRLANDLRRKLFECREEE